MGYPELFVVKNFLSLFFLAIWASMMTRQTIFLFLTLVRHWRTDLFDVLGAAMLLVSFAVMPWVLFALPLPIAWKVGALIMGALLSITPTVYSVKSMDQAQKQHERLPRI